VAFLAALAGSAEVNPSLRGTQGVTWCHAPPTVDRSPETAPRRLNAAAILSCETRYHRSCIDERAEKSKTLPWWGTPILLQLLFDAA
jgi:hypothetical protein